MKKAKLIVILVIGLLISSTSAQEQKSLSLDGTWKIIFDDKNEGRQAKWMKSEVFKQNKNQKDIQVPSCWEEMHEDYEGVAFYQKNFTLPADWKGKVIRLKFNAVNYLAEVYLNDNALGYHEGGFTPFEFNIEHLAKFDKPNTLTLRVVGPVTIGNKIIDGMGKMQTPQWRGAYTGGIWQSVTLKATDHILFDDIFVQPNITNNTAEIDYKINNTHTRTESTTLETLIRSVKDQSVVTRYTNSFLVRPGINKKKIILKLHNPTYWSPKNPYLYTLESKVLIDDKLSENIDIRFGMREFTIDGESLLMNGKPFYLKACFFEALYPVKLTNPDSKAMMIREIQLAKDAGFNMIRPWRKPPSEEWLDLADEMGVLVVGSLVAECMGKPEETPYLPRRIETELRETILRDRNRACIVQWELFNELHRPVLKNMLHSMSMVARELDPTRLILDESGGWAHGANLYQPEAFEPTAFNDIHTYPGPNITQKSFDKFLVTDMTNKQKKAAGFKEHITPPGDNVKPGLMSFVSELGYGSLPDLVDNNKQFAKKGNPKTPPYKYHKRLHEDTVKELAASGLDKMFPSPSDFYLKQQEVHGAANRRMIEATRSNPKINGYCIHALTTGDWIIGAGLLDIWRNPKKAVYQATKAANQEQIAILRMIPRNIFAERGTSINLIGVNELDPEAISYSISITDAKGAIVSSKENKLLIKKGVTQVLEEKIDTKEIQGQYTTTVIMSNNKGEPLSTTSRSFNVFTQANLATPKGKLAVIDLTNSIKPFLIQSGFTVEDFSSTTDLSTSVLVAKKQVKKQVYVKAIDSLNKFVEKGGKAIFLETPSRAFKRTGPQNSLEIKGQDFLPSKPVLTISMGLWDGILHMTHDHPIFKGLPTHVPMVGLYENIAPTESFKRHKGDRMVSTVAFTRFPNSNDFKRNYIGPGEVWWATDLLSVNHGKGKMILSTLKLIDPIWEDPVAQRLMFNLIEYLQQ